MADLIPVGSTLRAGKDAINAKIASLEAVDASQQKQISTEQQERIAADIAHANATVAHTAEQIRFVEGQSVKQKVDAQQAQINNIIGGPASSAAEVIDGRMGTDGTARTTIGTMIREIHSKLLAQNDQSTTIKRGLNLINASQASPADVVVHGRTLVNVTGRGGNCETTAGWESNGASALLETTNKVSGNYSLKVTLGVAKAGTIYRQVDVDPTKYYVVIADMKRGNSTDIFMYIDGGAGLSYYGMGFSNSSTFAPMYAKLNPTVLNGATSINVHAYVQGLVGQYSYVDCLRMYEVSAADYAKIDIDPEYKGEKLAEKFPYVDSVQHLRNPAIRKKGKNLLPPFSQWSLHANAVVTEPYMLTVTSTASNQNSSYTVKVLPNTIYYFSAVKTNGEYYVIAELDKNMQWVHQFYPGNISFFTSGPNTHYYEVIAVTSDPGVFVYTQPQLSIGSEIAPFEPQNDDYLYIPTVLSSNVDGSVKDSFNSALGTVTRRWKTGVMLDGELPWTYYSDFNGFKVVQIMNGDLPYAPKPTNNFGDGTTVAEKFDGKIIPNGNTDDAADKQFINGIGNRFMISVADTDSGWGETYTPSVAEIKAYFYGWKMYKDSNANSFYDGNGTKSWTPLQSFDGSNYTGYSSTLPMGRPNSGNVQGSYVVNRQVDAYKLDYQLAQGYEEQLIDDVGSIGFQSGGNQVELIEGVVVREKAKPYFFTAYNMYVINNISDSSCFLENKTSQIISVYRNGVVDKKWKIVFSVGGNGGAYTEINAADYDPIAEYTVTYQVLDKYRYTSNVIDATTRFKSNPKMVQDQLVQDIADLETQGAVNVRAIAELYKKVKALGG